jgi:hypothetical protein
MIIENKDWRTNADGAIEIWWNGHWLTSNQIALTVPDANYGLTIENRFRRAIAGDPKYASASANELITARSDRWKGTFLSKIDRCPKTLNVLYLWGGGFTHFPFKLWLVAIKAATCDKKFYAKGLCKYCIQLVEGCGPFTNAKLSEEARGRLAERESAPERVRTKALTARRRLLLPILMDIQSEPMSIMAVGMIVNARYGDLTESEFKRFTELMYANYEAAWLAKQIGDTDGAMALMSTKRDLDDGKEREQVRKNFEALLSKKKKTGRGRKPKSA